jgi:hypothetical protein
MYFRQKIFLLDPKQLKKITGTARSSMVSKLLDQIADAETATHCGAKKAAHLHHRSAYVPVLHKMPLERHEENYITDDDCTNLRIELELCSDSQEFIDRM